MDGCEGRKKGMIPRHKGRKEGRRMAGPLLGGRKPYQRRSNIGRGLLWASSGYRVNNIQVQLSCGFVGFTFALCVTLSPLLQVVRVGFQDVCIGLKNRNREK